MIRGIVTVVLAAAMIWGTVLSTVADQIGVSNPASSETLVANAEASVRAPNVREIPLLTDPAPLEVKVAGRRSVAEDAPAESLVGRPVAQKLSGARRRRIRNRRRANRARRRKSNDWKQQFLQN